MAEKGLTKRDLEQTFAGFEKRQDKKLKGLEERVDSKFKGLEERVDSKLKGFEERVIHQFHIISKGLVDQIKLLAEGHAGIIERLTLMEKENERQHLETRSLVKLSFAPAADECASSLPECCPTRASSSVPMPCLWGSTELDRRLTDLESQMKEMQEWKKQVEGRLQI